jgi:hypothetical protein
MKEEKKKVRWKRVEKKSYVNINERFKVKRKKREDNEIMG